MGPASRSGAAGPPRLLPGSGTGLSSGPGFPEGRRFPWWTSTGKIRLPHGV